MPLDLSMRIILREFNRRMQQGGPPQDLATLRAVTNRQMLPLWLPRLTLRSVEERAIPGPGGDMAARIYRPRATRPHGVVLFLHGGGFVHCGLDSHDGICCRLARASQCVVVSVDYRLAPEHRFPAAVEDATAALRWVAAHAESLGAPRRIAVAGDSAGGNLAAVTAQVARDEGGPEIRFQLLYYPATHGGLDVPSRREYARGYLLTVDVMTWYMRQYINDDDHVGDARFAPFLARSLAGLPPALVVTAECDPLRDEGMEYAQRLAEDGVPARYLCYSGTIHGFLNFYPTVAKGRLALAEGGRAIREALAA